MDVFFYQSVYLVKTGWYYLRNVIDILLVAVIFYIGYSYLAKTRAVQLFRGFLVVFILWFVAKLLQLETLNWLIKTMTTYVVIAIIVLFQPELRRIIARLGRKSWFGTAMNQDTIHLDQLVNAIISMAEDKIGALIVIERDTALSMYVENGVQLNAVISEELIRTIFFPNTALHDGALIIQEGKITAAACYLPLSDSKQLNKNHGARHRAGLGIAEETDALVLLSSEETGNISIMVNSKIYQKIKPTELKNMIIHYTNPKTAQEEKPPVK